MKGLELENVSKSFGAVDVLDDVSLSVTEGEFVSLLGPSGAGKSTIFRLLTGALSPDRGSIRVGGRSVGPNNADFAFMPQRDALLPWRRILDNVTLGLEVQGMSRTAARSKVLPLFSEFGLAGFEQRYPAQLSGGMRQRAALLRTVVQDRSILLLDEPFSALDALTRLSMQRWLETMWRRHRWTILMITHDVREAVHLSDRIYVLSARPARVLRHFEITPHRPRRPGDVSHVEAEVVACVLVPEFNGEHPNENSSS